MIYFTADLHFGHANIIKFCKRPFANVQQMDAALIENWNRTVSKHDTIYVVGDFTLGTNVQHYFHQLDGNIKVVSPWWHHDRHWMNAGKNYYNKQGDLVQILDPLAIVEIEPKMLGAEGQRSVPITMCHYEMQNWERKHYGGWHVFGHDHRLANTPEPNIFKLNIGVDANRGMPVSLNQLHAEMVIRGWYYGWSEND